MLPGGTEQRAEGGITLGRTRSPTQAQAQAEAAKAQAAARAQAEAEAQAQAAAKAHAEAEAKVQAARAQAAAGGQAEGEAQVQATATAHAEARFLQSRHDLGVVQCHFIEEHSRNLALLQLGNLELRPCLTAETFLKATTHRLLDQKGVVPSKICFDWPHVGCSRPVHGLLQWFRLHGWIHDDIPCRHIKAYIAWPLHVRCWFGFRCWVSICWCGFRLWCSFRNWCFLVWAYFCCWCCFCFCCFC